MDRHARILLVEDDKDYSDAVRLVLEKKRFEVEAAYDKHEGLEKVREFRPRLIILDIMLGKHAEGLRFAKEMRKNPEFAEQASVPILFLTGVREQTGWSFLCDPHHPESMPGAEILDEQVQNLYTSLYVKLADYPDHLEVFPAHGQGSLCGRGMSAKKSSTLGYERRANPMLGFPSFEAFKAEVMSAFPVRPKSFAHIIQTNLKGAATLDACPMDKALTPSQFEAMIADGAVIIDARDSAAFGGFHIPGSINIGFEKQLANWVGMVVDPNAEIILVVDDREDYDRMVTELHRIGYDLIFGYLSGGIMAWLMSGRPVEQLEQTSPHQLKSQLEKSDIRIIDVRTPAEWATGRIKWAEHFPLSDILDDKLPEAEKNEGLVLQCGSGYRSNIGASILKQAGYANVKSLAGGLFAWSNAGYPVVSD